MNRTRLVFGLAPLLVAMAISCGGGNQNASSPNQNSQAGAAGETDDQAATDLSSHHRHHHHGGLVMFIAMSVNLLGATPEQTAAITQIQADLHTKMQPAHDAEKAVLLTLADGVAAGSIDQSKLDTLVASLVTAAAGIHDAVVDSLNKLHATLTAQQRVALVEKVQAHFEVWHHQNVVEESAEKDAHGGHLGKIAKDLGLSPDQVEKIRTAFKASSDGAPHFDRAEVDSHLKSFGAAFEADNFDAKTLTTAGPVNAHMAEFGIKRMIRFYQAATPVLTPDQRTKLADELRRHANYKRTDTE